MPESRRTAPSSSPRPRRSAAALFACLLLPGLFAATASAQQPLPVELSGVPIAPRDVLVYTIDLGTLPNRPELHVHVAPTIPDPLIELEIEVTNWQGLILPPFPPGACVGGGVYLGGPTFTSDPSQGAASLELNLWGCEPRIDNGFWEGGTVEVRVSVIRFGQTGSPTNLDVSIRGVTQVPTNELVSTLETDVSPQTVFLEPVKDTVIYERNPTYSNGFGQYLWSGVDHELIGSSPFFFNRYDNLRSLLAFDIVDTLPPNAIVTNADLRLYSWGVLGNGGPVSLYRVATDPQNETWTPGNANPAGDEFFGALATISHANWSDRRTFIPWMSPGGDVETPSLGSITVTGAGYHTYSTAGLESAVQDMVDQQANADEDGFLLAGPGRPGLGNFDQAVQFASDQDASSSRRPQLRIDFTPAGPYADGVLTSGTVSFIGEGDDFRWIYDLDQDDILVTPINGVCEVIDDPENTNYPQLVPYTYSYEGTPGYVGVDCCAWQVDSPQTGTTGTGQALFFHNLDPTDPANMPPDSDGDGIRDLCDNCDGVPNGPAMGTCVGLGGASGTCQSDLDCGLYEFCSLSQEDADLDFAGDACSVPEPGFATGLFAAALLLTGVGRTRGEGRERARG